MKLFADGTGLGRNKTIGGNWAERCSFEKRSGMGERHGQNKWSEERVKMRGGLVLARSLNERWETTGRKKSTGNESCVFPEKCIIEEV